MPISWLAGCASEFTGELPKSRLNDRPSTALKQDSYNQNIRGSNVGFDMVWIPEGRFWIGRHEVTWDEYLLYCDFEESKKVEPGVDAVTKPSKPQEDVAPFDRGWGTGRRPAVGMSWNAAKKYCESLSLNTGVHYRLPTEKEWLLALGSKPQEPIDDHAWYKKNSGFMTQEVGKKKPNEYGLHDMYCNLWEYCGNAWSTTEPKRAVLRGGAWSSRSGQLTPTQRLGFDPDGKVIKTFRGAGNHYQSFLNAIKSGDTSKIDAPILEGHLSSALAHLGNISYLMGRDEVLSRTDMPFGAQEDANATFVRMREHLAANGLDMDKTRYQMGPALTFDHETECFTGERAAEANGLLQRPFREGYTA